MDDWQPIETAPNAESILVHYDDGHMVVIDAADNDYDWGPYRGKWPSTIAPTHWRPLPNPPQEPTDASGNQE